MTVERARVKAVHKPWGRNDLYPWYERRRDGISIGELWFERTGDSVPDAALLLKLLFTEAKLSIQVHPDDPFARSIGMPNGKTEAWYILGATPDAQVGLGLKRTITAHELRVAIEDGSIEDLLDWRPAAQGDVIFVPAGTIHAIGPGLIIAEVQQSSDATFRLFDYGRGRALDIDKAVAVATTGPAIPQSAPIRLTEARTLLVANAWFGMERIELPAHSTWVCGSRQEAWLLVLDGSAVIAGLDVSVSDAVFLEDDQVDIAAGPDGLRYLLSYVGSEPSPVLSRGRDGQDAGLSRNYSTEALA